MDRVKHTGIAMRIGRAGPQYVHWRSPSVLGKPALVITTGCHVPAENAILLSS
jgi:hypothetical protein